MFVCECGKLIRENVPEETFKVYINTSRNPSTSTIGHKKCGLIFNFVDGDWPKKYSSKKELKILAAAFASSNDLSSKETGVFLLEIERLKSYGKFSDDKILVCAYQRMLETRTVRNQPHFD